MVNTDYKISIISDNHFDNLVAEIIFEKKDFGIIVSQEFDRNNFEVSIFSFINGKQKFYDTEKCPNCMVKFSLLLSALTEAKDRLNLLDVSSDK